MSTKNIFQPKTNVNQNQMSTKNKCQPKTNVNQKQMSTKNKCQQKKCQPKTVNLTQHNSTQPNGCHIEATQPCGGQILNYKNVECKFMELAVY